jgi:hypothetical protein
MLIIEWVGYNFVKHVIFHYFIIINRLLREINLDPYVLEMYSGRFVVGLDVDEKGWNFGCMGCVLRTSLRLEQY